MKLDIGLREIQRSKYRKEKIEIDLSRFDKECWENKEFCEIAILKYKAALNWIDSSFYSDKEMALFIVKKYGKSIDLIDQSFLDQEDFVKDLVENTIYHFKKASDRLKNDKDFILSLLQYSAEIVNMMSENLKTDKEFLKVCIKTNGSVLIQPKVLEFTGLDIKDYSNNYQNLNMEEKWGLINWLIINEPQSLNDEMVKLLIDKKDLRAVPIEKRNEKNFVLYALKKNTENIFFVNNELQHDRDVIMCMLEQEKPINMWKKLPTKFANDRGVVKKWMEACKHSSFFIYPEDISEDLMEDFEITKFLVESNPKSYIRIKENFKLNDEIILLALADEYNFKNIPEEKKQTIEQHLVFVKQNIWLFNQFSEEIKNDREFLEKAIKINFATFFMYLNGKSFCPVEDKEFLKSISKEINEHLNEYTGKRFDVLSKYHSIIREYHLLDAFQEKEDSKRVRRKI